MGSTINKKIVMNDVDTTTVMIVDCQSVQDSVFCSKENRAYENSGDCCFEKGNRGTQHKTEFLDISNSTFKNVVIEKIFHFLKADNTEISGTFSCNQKNCFVIKGIVLPHLDSCNILGNSAKTMKTISRTLKIQEEYSDSEQWGLAYHLSKRKNLKVTKKPISMFHQLISNYGISPQRFLTICVLFLFGFAAIFWCLGISYEDSFYLSGISFFTIGFGDVAGMGESVVIKSLTILEGGIGVVSMAYLVTLLCRNRY